MYKRVARRLTSNNIELYSKVSVKKVRVAI